MIQSLAALASTSDKNAVFGASELARDRVRVARRRRRWSLGTEPPGDEPRDGRDPHADGDDRDHRRPGPSNGRKGTPGAIDAPGPRISRATAIGPSAPITIT